MDAGHVTIHRLLWEYGRDTFGDRAGKSFSEKEREWLKEIAKRYRDGVREFSLRAPGGPASRLDLSEKEGYARFCLVSKPPPSRGRCGGTQTGGKGSNGSAVSMRSPKRRRRR
jgi:hypothetical protein